MLKALELCGFKSFADKTRFEFPPGITVVVGPNGSGKSNIVDGMKWVLGEQSAKSLRGKEMADVIFKGSGGTSSARRPASMAEVTIVFDNSRSLFPVDSAEVRVTRRVYRSGEGEYLINGNACRLRDVKDIFRGTGMGTDAYSLIEQGKVDQLLQASPRDRRAIFEEAAGISRFKAKKVETQRRLERVEQNLERLKDIVDEVESQLRSVRNQASKARRYKEYTDRLKELRTHIGLTDWRQLTAELDKIEAQLAEVNSTHASLQQELDEQQLRLAEVDGVALSNSQGLHEVESASAAALQELAGYESTVSHEYQRLDELVHEIERHRRQWHGMTARAGDLGLQLQHFQQQLATARSEDDLVRARLAAEQTALDQLETQLADRRRRRDVQREEHAHQLRIANDLNRRLATFESERLSVGQQLERSQQHCTSAAAQLDAVRQEQLELTAREAHLQDAEQAARDELNQARQILHTSERERNQQQQQAVDLQRRFTVASERAKLLQDLERRNEGLSPGVKELLLRAQHTPLGALATIRGMVADLIRVDVRMAPLIDAALGELTQYVVVSGPRLVEQIAAGEVPLQGRVGILDAAVQPRGGDRQPPFVADRTVLGRADQFVEAEAQYAPLIEHLLGQTWCVETLQDALRLRPSVGSTQTWPRFVTRAGEILEPDGRLLAGPRQAVLGLVSRRSELRSLQHEIVELEPQMRQTDARIEQLRRQIADSEHQVDSLSSQYDGAASQLMNARLATRSISERLSNLEQQLAGHELEASELTARRALVEQQGEQYEQKLTQVNALLADLDAQLGEHKQTLTSTDAERQRQLEVVTAVKVELAKSEQRIDSLSGQLVRYEEDQRERERALRETQSHLRLAQDRQQQAERAILHASTAQAELYLRQEQLQTHVQQMRAAEAERLAERRQIQLALDQARKRQQALEQTRHQLELAAHRARLERESLVQRVRDDYDIDLAEFATRTTGAVTEQQQQRDEVDREINELRRRLSNIGAVNMAALEEIESLEGRHNSLAAQYQDLVDAKESLARIIHKINADSRRLFTETLEAIRANFQALFRRVFGGGHADIVLEEGLDILEAGIDIVATPPGKHSLGISLLSGGERALTAVTLLLAIFQYRPSPFCVLDEVDGPLDEANIGRFVDVLTEFLQWTKFVVVTHSKKTMTAAHTLYGVTMQESGVSKRVSVQFEDVSEDGHISQEALQRNRSADDQGASPDDDNERGAA